MKKLIIIKHNCMGRNLKICAFEKAVKPFLKKHDARIIARKSLENVINLKLLVEYLDKDGILHMDVITL